MSPAGFKNTETRKKKLNRTCSMHFLLGNSSRNSVQYFSNVGPIETGRPHVLKERIR